MYIKSDAKNGQRYQKWLFAWSEILSKIGVGFISNFLLKAQVLYLTILNGKIQAYLWRLKQTSLSFVWFYQSVFLSKFFCISPSDSEANRDDADAESRFPLFFSFSASFKNSSLREKVVKLSSFWDWWAKSLFVSTIFVKYNFFPALTMAAGAKKKDSGAAICSRYQRVLSRFWARLRILNLIARLC